MPDDTQFIFLIGAARSGTKYLRDVLGESVEVTTTPYDLNYIWRHGNEKVEHDDLSPDDLSPATVGHIRRQIERMARKSGSTAPIVLEKTVSNTLRVDVVRRVFPEARFIYLERDGRSVVESAYRQWTAPADRKYLLEKLRYFPLREWRYGLWFVRNLASGGGTPIWGPRYEGIERDVESRGVAEACALQWARCVTEARASLDTKDTFTVEYERLADDQVITSLLEWIGVEPGPSLEAHRSRFRVQRTWPGAIPADDLAACEHIVQRVPPLADGDASAEQPRINQDLP